MSKKDTVKVLNDLIQTVADGKKGFIDASKEVTKAELKDIFIKRSMEFEEASAELQKYVSYLGGRPEDNGTVVGAVIRGWTKIRTAANDPNIVMLEAAESVEDKARARYAKALAEALPGRVRLTLQRQHEGVARNHNLIRHLRDQYKKTAQHNAKG